MSHTANMIIFKILGVVGNDTTFEMTYEDGLKITQTVAGIPAPVTIDGKPDTTDMAKALQDYGEAWRAGYDQEQAKVNSNKENEKAFASVIGQTISV